MSRLTGLGMWVEAKAVELTPPHDHDNDDCCYDPETLRALIRGALLEAMVRIREADSGTIES